MDRLKQAVIDAASNWVEAEDAAEKAREALRKAVAALDKNTTLPNESMSAEVVYEELQQTALLKHTLEELDDLRQKLEEGLTDEERGKLTELVTEKAQLVEALERKRKRP